MESSFASFVALIRQSSNVQLDGYTLTFACRNSPEVRRLLGPIEEWKAANCTVNGKPYFGDLAAVADGTSLEFEFRDVAGNSKLVVSNLAALVEFQGGQFQCAPPAEYYLLAERYAPGDIAIPERVADYLRIARLVELLREAADADLPWKGRSKLIFLAGRKLEVPVCYGVSDLRNVPADAEIDDFRQALLSKPHAEQKRELLKRLFIRMFQDVPESDRFARLLAGFKDVRNSFSADLDHFLSEFGFEKLREQFERKRLDYMLKINATVGDLGSKILAIPIAQGIVASQFKEDSQYQLANVALLAGSFVFTLIGCILIVGHWHSFREIKREVEQEQKQAKAKFPELFVRIAETYDSVIWRVTRFAPSVVILTLVLLVAGFLFTLASFEKFPPCAGCMSKVTAEVGSWLDIAWRWVAGLLG